MLNLDTLSSVRSNWLAYEISIKSIHTGDLLIDTGEPELVMIGHKMLLQWERHYDILRESMLGYFERCLSYDPGENLPLPPNL